MKKFNALIESILAEQVGAQQPQQNQPQTNDVNASQPFPNQNQQGEQESSELTDEAKVYLIGLIIKALAVDPSTIPVRFDVNE